MFKIPVPEIWKDIPGFEGYYQVSNLGRIKSFKQFKQGKILKPIKGNCGYLQITLDRNLGLNKRVHRLVLESFLGKSENLINHINGDKLDNRLINLEYCTSVENMRHWATVVKKQKKYGAHFVKKTNNWRSVIQIDKKLKNLGRFKSQEEAHQAFYNAYISHYGVAPW